VRQAKARATAAEQVVCSDKLVVVLSMQSAERQDSEFNIGIALS
jgi:hypothetical protein